MWLPTWSDENAIAPRSRFGVTVRARRRIFDAEQRQRLARGAQVVDERLDQDGLAGEHLGEVGSADRVQRTGFLDVDGEHAGRR